MSAKVRQALEAKILAGQPVTAPRISRVMGPLRTGSAKRRPADQATRGSGIGSSSDGFFVPTFCSKPLIGRQLGGSLGKYRESGHFLLSGATEQAALRYAGFN
jgi:hypothetical protein